MFNIENKPTLIENSGIYLTFMNKLANMILTSPLSPRLSSVCKRICEHGGWNVSNLRLQKLLYLAHMVCLGRTGKPLVDETFEAWMYGPVVPQLYKKMKIFGAEPITNRFYEAIPLSSEIDELIQDVCNTFKEKSDAVLVASTHRKGGAWAKNYRHGEYGIPIPNDDILDEYRAKTSA